MSQDPEQQLYSDMADLTEKVPKIQNAVKSINTRLNKLSSRIENLELMAFQEQINSLNDKIDSLNGNLLNVSRAIARFEMDFTQSHMCVAIRNHVSGQKQKDLEEHVKMLFAKYREVIKHSLDPVSIALEFRVECVKCSNEYNLDAFF